MIIMRLRKILPMINIRRIEPHEVSLAKHLIYDVAHRVFNDPRPLEESIASFEARGTLDDMSDIQQIYFENDGIFLVLTDNEQIIGTGAIRKLDTRTCELKRVWLLFDYHGKGLGYRIIQELLAFAREKGYQRIRLETDRQGQSRAYELYKRIGFYEVPRYSDNEEDIAMEMVL